MIIEVLMNLVYNLISLLMSPVNIPGLPEDVTQSMDTFISYLDYGSSFFAFPFPAMSFIINIYFILYSVS